LPELAAFFRRVSASRVIPSAPHRIRRALQFTDADVPRGAAVASRV
jgi:hypothetical protein